MVNIDKRLVRTAVATALITFGISPVVASQDGAAAAEAQATTPKAEQKPVEQAAPQVTETAKTQAPAAAAAAAEAQATTPKAEQKPTESSTPQVTEAAKAPAVTVAAEQPPAPPQAVEDFENKVVATVDGEPITGGMLGAHFAGRTQKMRGMKQPAHMQGMALKNLISIKVLAKAAHEAGIDSRPGVVMAINLQREQLLAQMLLQERASSQAPSEEALKKAYDEKYAASRQEFKACHILVKTEDEAKSVIEQLGKGGDFATLAKEKSIDPSSKKGGDLGWFEASQMVQPFSDAVATMEIGKYSAKPVQTQFGWHVIKLEEKRAATPPDFNTVRPRLMSELQRAALTQYIDELRSKAKIEMTEPLNQPAPKAAPAAPTK